MYSSTVPKTNLLTTSDTIFFHSDLQEGYKWYCHNFLKFFEIECFAYLGIYKQLNILAIFFLYHVNMHAMYFLNILFKCIIQFFLMY